MIFFDYLPLTITLHVALSICDCCIRYIHNSNHLTCDHYITIYNNQKYYKVILSIAGVCLVLDFLQKAFRIRRFCKVAYSRELDYQPTNCTVIDMLAKILLGSDVYTRPKQQTIDDDQDTDTDTDTDTDIGTVEDPETIEQVIIEEVIDIDSTRNAMSETKTE